MLLLKRRPVPILTPPSTTSTAPGPRPALPLSRLPAHALRRHSPHTPLVKGRRDPPGRADVALRAAPPAAARGPLHDRPGLPRPLVLPAPGRARDPGLRLTAGGHDRRRR